MRFVFEIVETKATVTWADPATGKKRQRTEKFSQTINPFNKGADGQPKSREQIREEINRAARLWKLRVENDIRDGKYPD